MQVGPQDMHKGGNGRFVEEVEQVPEQADVQPGTGGYVHQTGNHLLQWPGSVLAGLQLVQVVKQVDENQLAAVAGEKLDGLRQGAADMQHRQALPLIDSLKQRRQQR